MKEINKNPRRIEGCFFRGANFLKNSVHQMSFITRFSNQ